MLVKLTITEELLLDWGKRLTGEIVQEKVPEFDQSKKTEYADPKRKHQRPLTQSCSFETMKTYKLPTEKMKVTATFCRNGLCSLQTIGMGMHRIKTSSINASDPIVSKNCV